MLYTCEINRTNIQSEVIDKSAIISTQKWTNSLGTAHSKMGGPTFVNEKVVHILEKNNIVLNFETKVRRRLLLYAFKSFLQISNLSSLTKAPLVSLKDGQTVLAQPTQRWAALLLSMKKWFTYQKNINNVVLNFETKVRQTVTFCI